MVEETKPTPVEQTKPNIVEETKPNPVEESNDNKPSIDEGQSIPNHKRNVNGEQDDEK